MAANAWRARPADHPAGTSVKPGLAVLAAAGPALARRVLALRQGQAHDEPHSIEEAAEHIGVDPTFARTLDEYLQARRRLRLDRSGWRAGFRRLG